MKATVKNMSYAKNVASIFVYHLKHRVDEHKRARTTNASRAVNHARSVQLAIEYVKLFAFVQETQECRWILGLAEIGPIRKVTMIDYSFFFLLNIINFSN